MCWNKPDRQQVALARTRLAPERWPSGKLAILNAAVLQSFNRFIAGYEFTWRLLHLQL